MHLPDQFLSNQTSFALIGFTAGFLFISLKKIFQAFFEKTEILLPKLQMANNINFDSLRKISIYGLKVENNKVIQKFFLLLPILYLIQLFDLTLDAGVPGHLIGGVMAGLILGPWFGLFTLALIIAFQALFLGDGGILALGANIFNMAVIPVIGGYYLFKLLNIFLKNRYWSAGLSAWLTLILAASALSIEMFISGKPDFFGVFFSLVTSHVLIGFIEAILTIVVLILFEYVFDQTAKNIKN